MSILRRARGRNRCRRASTISLAAFPARILAKTFFLPLPQLIVKEEKRRRKGPCGTTIAPIAAAKCSCQKLTSSLSLSRSVRCGTLSGSLCPCFSSSLSLNGDGEGARISLHRRLGEEHRRELRRNDEPLGFKPVPNIVSTSVSTT